MNADEVLNILVESQPLLNWLGNDGRQYIADARLSVFRSDEHFAVFTEFPHFSYGGDDFTNWLGYAGNCLAPHIHDAMYSSMYSSQSLIEKVPARKEDYSNVDDWFVERDAFSVKVAGSEFDFRPSEEDYLRAGIIFKDEGEGANKLSPGQLLRFVSVSLDHPFFYSEEELRKLIDQSGETKMSLFLQTSAWQHPVYLVTDDDPFFESDWIENIPCWQVLARAIASGDLSEWEAQDTSEFNTDWLNLERIYRENDAGGM